MSFIDRLEMRLGRYAIPNLIRYVVLFNALTFVLAHFEPGYVEALTLDSHRILQGQVWRLVSWIFIPPHFQVLWVFLALMILWTFGEMLEVAWGTFRLNLFYLTGMVGCTVAAFLTNTESSAYNTMLNLSLFFAVATINPNYQLLFLFVLPVKIKWLALLSAGLLAFECLGASWDVRIAMLISFSNYLLFFGPVLISNIQQNHRITKRRYKFETAKKNTDETLHHCATCNRTEISHPELNFRVAADNQEYCIEHLPKRL